MYLSLGGATMFGKENMPDNRILKDVNKRLAKAGGGRSRITATVRNGQVTVTGQIQYENQRHPVMQAVSRVDGVQSVSDQITLVPREPR
jgi:osmotically-inducible protein OsmY